MHTFPLVTFTSEQMAESHCSQEEAGQSFGPILPSLHLILSLPAPAFTQEQFTFFREEIWVCGLSQTELWLMLKGILVHGGIEPCPSPSVIG